MSKLAVAGWGLVLSGFLALATLQAADEKEPKYTVKDVMKIAHKEGLLKKVVEGESTKADAEELAELYRSLAQNQPPMGEAASWKEKTIVILEAAEEVVEGKEGAKAKLKAAVNCANCHKAHRPPA